MKKRGLSLKLIILLIVSAAFVLARFGTAGADEIPADKTADQVEVGSTRAISDAPEQSGSADRKEQAARTFGREDGDSLAMPVIKLIGALLLVVGAIYGFLYVLKRMMGQGGTRGRGRMIEVLETSTIAPKKSVALVRYTDKAVLIGVADNAISVLAELNPEETKGIVTEASVGTSQPGFKGILESARGRLDNLGFQGFKAIIRTAKKDSTQAA